MNRNGVSISFINRGFFARKSDTQAFDVDAHNNKIGKVYPASDVTTTASIYDPSNRRHWHKYTPAQIDAAGPLIRALRDDYGLTEIVGHDDVSIDGKSDPGPLFPMEEWRTEFGMRGPLGPKVRVQSPDGTLNLRRRPSTSSVLVTTLHNGDEIFLRSAVYTYRAQNALLVDSNGERYLTGWISVDIDGSNRHSGFVYMKHLSSNPLINTLRARL